jgi:hypothetical protein
MTAPDPRAAVLAMVDELIACAGCDDVCATVKCREKLLSELRTLLAVEEAGREVRDEFWDPVFAKPEPVANLDKALADLDRVRKERK